MRLKPSWASSSSVPAHSVGQHSPDMEAGPSSGRIQVGANGLVRTLVFVSETEYESRFGKADTYTGWVKATQAGEPGYLLPESMLRRRPRRRSRSSGQPEANDKAPCSEIRDKLNSTAEPSAVAGPSAVADSDDDDAPDPMDALDEVPDTLIKATKKAVRTPHKKTARSMVTEPSAVAGPSAVADGDDRSETTTVCLYLKPNNRNIKSASIYIRVDCIDWLLAYAADELFYQGVKRDTAADEDLKVANCPAVADVNLEWDFDTHVWEAEFLAGPFQGVTRSFGIADLTASRLARLRSVGIGQPDPRSPTSALPTKKQVAKEFITLWCDAICKERDSFETDWELSATVGNTSTATKRRRVAS